MEMEDTDSILERQTLNLNPDQWVRLYRDRVYDELGVPVPAGGEEEIELTENDLDALDKFMDAQEAAFQAKLKGRQNMSGASIPTDWRDVRAQAEPLQWGEWT